MHSKIFLLLIGLGWQENSDPQKSHLQVSPKPRTFGVLKTQTPKNSDHLVSWKFRPPKIQPLSKTQTPYSDLLKFTERRDQSHKLYFSP